jgi:hypothetical protein
MAWFEGHGHGHEHGVGVQGCWWSVKLALQGHIARRIRPHCSKDGAGIDDVLRLPQIRWSNVYFGFARLLLLKKR